MTHTLRTTAKHRVVALCFSPWAIFLSLYIVSLYLYYIPSGKADYRSSIILWRLFSAQIGNRDIAVKEAMKLTWPWYKNTKIKSKSQ